MDEETKRLTRQLLARLSADETRPAVSLSESLADMLGASEIEKITREQYERSLRFFELFLGRPAVSTDLTHEKVNAWLAWLATVRNASATTIRNNRVGLCRLWNYLVQEDLAQPYSLRKLRIAKPKPKVVQAWTKKQVQQLLKAAGEMAGTLKCGIPANQFFRALIHVAYDSGLRPSDLRRLQWQSVDFERRIATIVQHKTGNPHSFAMSDATIKALQQITKPTRPLVFPLGKAGVYIRLNKLFKLAEKHGFRRKVGQSLGMLRKVHATEVYKQHGLSAAAESLGHVSGHGIAKRHYVDSSAQHVGKLPSELEP